MLASHFNEDHTLVMTPMLATAVEAFSAVAHVLPIEQVIAFRKAGDVAIRVIEVSRQDGAYKAPSTDGRRFSLSVEEIIVLRTAMPTPNTHTQCQ